MTSFVPSLVKRLTFMPFRYLNLGTIKKYLELGRLLEENRTQDDFLCYCFILLYKRIFDSAV